MNDVRIDTPRGITLAGTLQLPAGAAPIDLEVSTTSEDTQPPQARPEGVVLLAHDFLTDRHGQSGRLDWIGARYREAGLATLNLDFSGLGESDDDVITLAGEAEDLRAASSWLAGLGFTRQMIHANGFGATAALLARPEHVRTAVLVGAIVGPQSILWEEIFSPEQLDELAQHGLTRLVDDNPNSREWNVLSKETLADFSMQKPERTLADLPASLVALLENAGTPGQPSAQEALPSLWASQQLDQSLLGTGVVAPEVEFTQLMESISLPTLLLTGDRRGEARVGAQLLAQLMEQNPHICGQVMPGAGHQVRRANPQAYYDVVDAFLQTQVPANATS